MRKPRIRSKSSGLSRSSPQRIGFRRHAQKWQIKAAAISVEWDRYNKTYYFLDDAHGNTLRRENGDVLVFDNEEDAKKALETAFRMQGKKCKMCSSNRNNRAELPRLP